MSKLITLESLDSGGKGTQVQIIKEYFDRKNIKHEHFHFPMYGHNQFSDIISRFLRGEFGSLDKVDPYFVANIYAMDRFMFKTELERALNENDVVLLDRYVFSNIAYQCAKVPKMLEMTKLYAWIWEFEFNFLKLPYPNLTLFLDVPTDVTGERLKEERTGDDRSYLNGKKDIHEVDMTFQEKVREMYLYLHDNVGYKIVECVIGDKVLNPKEVFENYIDCIETILKYKHDDISTRF